MPALTLHSICFCRFPPSCCGRVPLCAFDRSAVSLPPSQELGVAATLGLQGGSTAGPSSYLPDFNVTITSEAKHYVAYGYGPPAPLHTRTRTRPRTRTRTHTQHCWGAAAAAAAPAEAVFACRRCSRVATALVAPVARCPRRPCHAPPFSPRCRHEPRIFLAHSVPRRLVYKQAAWPAAHVCRSAAATPPLPQATRTARPRTCPSPRSTTSTCSPSFALSTLSYPFVWVQWVLKGYSSTRVLLWDSLMFGRVLEY